MKRKLLAMLAALGLVPAVMAEGTNAIDLSAASTFLTSYTSAIKEFFTATATIDAISGVVGCFLLLWIIGLVVMIVKKLGQKSK